MGKPKSFKSESLANELIGLLKLNSWSMDWNMNGAKGERNSCLEAIDSETLLLSEENVLISSLLLLEICMEYDEPELDELAKNVSLFFKVGF